jgi:hypothetical protein
MHRSKNRSEASPKTKMTSPTKCCASGGSRRRRAPGSCSAFGSLVMYPAGILERDELATASNGRFQAVALGEAMRALLAQLRDFEIANCLIKADRTHNDGKRSHERPSQRRASGDRASDNPNAKGNDTYRD